MFGGVSVRTRFFVFVAASVGVDPGVVQRALLFSVTLPSELMLLRRPALSLEMSARLPPPTWRRASWVGPLGESASSVDGSCG